MFVELVTLHQIQYVTEGMRSMLNVVIQSHEWHTQSSPNRNFLKITYGTYCYLAIIIY